MTTDILAAATAQYAAWHPEILGLLAAVFLVEVAFIALKIGKRGIDAAGGEPEDREGYWEDHQDDH
jgi:hypothetical protein